MAQLKSTTVCGNLSVLNNIYNTNTYSDYVSANSGNIVTFSSTTATITTANMGTANISAGRAVSLNLGDSTTSAASSPSITLNGSTGNIVANGTGTFYSVSLSAGNGLIFTNADYTDKTAIAFKNGNNDGAGMLIGCAGYTGIGGGESAATVYTALTAGQDSSIGTLSADSEYLVLSGDAGVLMYTNTSGNTFSTNYRIKFTQGGIDAVGSVKALDYTISNKAKMTYDNTNKCINFAFI